MPVVRRIRRIKTTDAAPSPSPSKANGTKRPKLSGLLSGASSFVDDNRAISMVLYGPPGSGKTSMMAHAPDPLFLIHRKEQGIKDLMSRRLCPKVDVLETEAWEDQLTILGELKTQPHDYKWLVVDSLMWTEQACFNSVCQNLYDGDWSKKGFYDYWAGPRSAETDSNYWPAYISALTDLRDAGLNICLIGHAKVKSMDPPDGDPYMKWTPELEERSWRTLSVWVDNIFFINWHRNVTKEHKRARGKAELTGRFLECQLTAACECKSKGMPPIVKMGDDPDGAVAAKESWDNFINAYYGKDA